MYGRDCRERRTEAVSILREVPDLPSGDGTQYEIECGACGGAMVSVQISTLMTHEERSSDPFTDYRYAEQFIQRAKTEAIELWNTRATPPAAQVQGEQPMECSCPKIGEQWDPVKHGKDCPVHEPGVAQLQGELGISKHGSGNAAECPDMSR